MRKGLLCQSYFRLIKVQVNQSGSNKFPSLLWLNKYLHDAVKVQQEIINPPVALEYRIYRGKIFPCFRIQKPCRASCECNNHMKRIKFSYILNYSNAL